MTTAPTLVQVTVDDEGLAFVRLADDSTGNAFTPPLVAQLEAALQRLHEADVKACILTGGDDVFSSGGDRDTLLDLAEGRLSPYDLRLTASLLRVPVPTIAAMAGAAVGGGFVFGLCCDVVLLSRESRYGCNFMDLGFTPGMGATAILRSAFGDYMAAEMMFGARFFRGSELERHGLINRILPRVEVEDEARRIAGRIVDKDRLNLTMLKRTLSMGRRRAFEEALTQESLMHDVSFLQPDVQRRIREGFPGGAGDE